MMRALPGRIVAAVAIPLVAALPAAAATIESIADRTEDPVIISGSILPDLQGLPIDRIVAAAYDPARGTFAPIPFQIDERFNHLVNPGGSVLVYELMYDVLGEDDGRLDGDDEIALLYADAGEQAPPGAWVSGADPTRFEIRIVDPRPGGPHPDRYVYLFTGFGLERSPVSYMVWPRTASSAIQGGRFELDFTDRWLLTGFRVETPCGAGTDLIDRVKGRAGLTVDRAESEETWNPISFYLGGILGPVRAIRYVRGAASGVNTIHHDVVYRGFWERVVNLRVHPIPTVWFYFDMLPRAGTTFLSSENPGGVDVDGRSDSGISTDMPDWSIVRGPDGGFATIYEITPSPFVQSAYFYYLDDARFDDKPDNASTYGDDDDGAYGVHGAQLETLTGSETDTITEAFRVYPLCSNEGDAALGDALHDLIDYPLQASALAQSLAGEAVRSLVMARVGTDVVLGWQPIAGASKYRVYTANSADLPRESWTLLGEPTAPGFTDLGAAADGVPRVYSVTAVLAGGEGPW